MENITDLTTKLFNIASVKTDENEIEPNKKEYIRKKNEEYETKIKKMGTFKKLKPIAEKGNFHKDVVDMDSTYKYTCFDLQRLVERLNNSGELPLKVYYEMAEYVNQDYENMNTIYYGVNCKASFRWEKKSST